MPRIAEHSFAALQQNWMIKGRPGGESGVHRQGAKGGADVIEPGSLNQSKARVSGSQAANQRHKSRTEQRETCDGRFRKDPAPDEIAPQKRQNNKIAPHHELQIVPFPRRGLNKIAETENHDCRQYKSDIRWWPIAPTPLALPNTPE